MLYVFEIGVLALKFETRQTVCLREMMELIRKSLCQQSLCVCEFGS